ncbi:hypothetical protein [Saccharothrix lopnurensis]|uniref:Uncharacterized protein n=1 Tax=Saccharothrix lopnurensis TaxID=1670621 RepID=A0ABW1NYN4_9PSEU
MPIPRRIEQARDAGGAKLRQVFSTRRGGGAPGGAAFARASADEVTLTEEYRYHQEISSNDRRETGDVPPSGTIRVTVPYDGHKYFTRAAVADVSGHDPRPAAAVIGHLSFADHHKTDLSEVLDLSEGYGSMAVEVPIAEFDEAGMVTDGRTCVIEHEYRPAENAVRVLPVSVLVDLVDPDGANLHEALRTALDPGTQVEQVADELTKYVSFRSYLLLSVQVVLHLPNRRYIRGLHPKVSLVSLRWPTITSLSEVTLQNGRGDQLTLKYNPSSRSLEWSNVPMALVDGHGVGDTAEFRSEKRYLLIRQPGELYQQDAIDGTVCVEVNGYLLSGLRARRFDALGTQAEQPKLVSRITTDLHLVLDDAFARREMLPCQHLHFDEVIPDNMRIADIRAVLETRGFQVEEWPSRQDGGGWHRRLLRASRQAGPDTMWLWLLVDGRRFETTREKQQPGGQTFTSTFESGELKVFMCGALPGTSRDLTLVMNALHLTLRERFERLKARR